MRWVQILSLSLFWAAFPICTQAQTPQLACAGGPATAPDPIVFGLGAVCSRAVHDMPSQSATITSWTSTTNIDRVSVSCPHTPLNASAHATLVHACIGLPNGGAQLVVEGDAQALAGYDAGYVICDDGNYCSALAGTHGSGNANFTVSAAQANNYCLGVASLDATKAGIPGYTTSHWFNPDGVALDYIRLVNPGGQTFQLAPSATYLLNMQGTWQVQIPMSIPIGSNMSENSGTYLISENLVLQFAQANANGSCPAAQLSAAARTRVSKLIVMKAKVIKAKSLAK